MTAFADINDVEDTWLGAPLTTAQQAVADRLVVYASALVRARFANIDTRIAAGTLDPALARLAVVQMVIRVLRNPELVRSKSIDDYTVTYAEEGLAAELEITNAETRLLRSRTVKRVGIIRPPAAIA